MQDLSTNWKKIGDWTGTNSMQVYNLYGYIIHSCDLLFNTVKASVHAQLSFDMESMDYMYSHCMGKQAMWKLQSYLWAADNSLEQTNYAMDVLAIVFKTRQLEIHFKMYKQIKMSEKSTSLMVLLQCKSTEPN